MAGACPRPDRLGDQHRCLTVSAWARWCRGNVSATTYTVVGVCNKAITIVLNVMIWDKHASAVGLFGLVVCLGAGLAYKQAPLRSTAM